MDDCKSEGDSRGPGFPLCFLHRRVCLVGQTLPAIAGSQSQAESRHRHTGFLLYREQIREAPPSREPSILLYVRRSARGARRSRRPGPPLDRFSLITGVYAQRAFSAHYNILPPGERPKAVRSRRPGLPLDRLSRIPGVDTRRSPRGDPEGMLLHVEGRLGGFDEVEAPVFAKARGCRRRCGP
jgi:hypothetical protein